MQRLITDQELNRLLDTARQYDKLGVFEPLLILAFYGAVRKKEILDMIVKDIDLDRGVIWVRNLMERNKNGREVQIPSVFRGFLIERLAQAQNNFEHLFGEIDKNGWAMFKKF